MSAYHEYLINMKDGTIKQINPITETEVWSVPGRDNRPLRQGYTPKMCDRHEPEDYCDFCKTQLDCTPPEKNRLQLVNGQYVYRPRLNYHEAHNNDWLFRRVSNLFEIVGVNYWNKNYGYHLDEDLAQWKRSYLDDPAGRQHVLHIVDYKLKMAGKSQEEINSISELEKLHMVDPFFAGTHDLIICHRHYLPGDGQASELFASGDLTPEEHYQYMKFTIAAMSDIYKHNRYVRYVTVFQNWLSPAGASFDHLHRQLVGLDEWGTALDWATRKVRENPNIYNELLVNFAAHTNRVVAENDHAIAFVDIGHRYPSLAIYSKSRHVRPNELSPEELRDMSDLIHALHAALGRKISCNEEWYYTPKDSLDRIPFHVLIKLRINTPAGFEGGTRIYVNPLSPYRLRDMIVPALYNLRYNGKVQVKNIAEECPVEPNSLRYHNLG